MQVPTLKQERSLGKQTYLETSVLDHLACVEIEIRFTVEQVEERRHLVGDVVRRARILAKQFVQRDTAIIQCQLDQVQRVQIAQ